MTEDQLQQKCYEWANNNFCLKHHKPRLRIFSVPNGGTRNKIEAMKLKATGLTPGVSDLIGLFTDGKAVFFELKTSTGIQSDTQIDFEQSIKELNFDYHLIRSLEQFKTVWCSYTPSNPSLNNKEK